MLVFYSLAWSILLFFCIPIVSDQNESWHILTFYFLISVPFLFVLTLACSLLLWKKSDPYKKIQYATALPRLSMVRLISVALLVCASVWGLYFLAFYPAIMNFDVINQWEQVTSKNFNDWHPVFHSLYLFLIQYISWGTPSSVSAAQIIFLLAILGYLLFILQQAGLSQASVIGLAAYFAIHPLIGLYNITLWKDTPFSFCILLLTTFLFEIFYSHGKWLDSRSHQCLLIISLIGVALFRHNGILSAFFCVLSLLWICSSRWKEILVVALSSLFMILVIKYPLYALLKVPEHSSHKHVLNSAPCIYAVGSVIAADRPISSEEQSILANFMPMAQWREMYNPQDLVSLVFHAKPNWGYLISKSGRKLFRKVCANLVLHNLDVIWHSLLQISSYEWRIRELPSDTYSYIIEYDSDPNILHVMPNNLNIKPNPILQSFHRFVIDYVFFPLKDKYSNPLRNKNGAASCFNWFLYRPAFFYWLSLYCLGFLACRLHFAKVLVLGVPLFVNAVSIMLLSFTFESRYNYAAFLTAPLFVSLLFLDWQKWRVEAFVNNFDLSAKTSN